MFEIKPYPAFSWSLSRSKLFLDCRRKYGYNYYISHNGWLRDANILAKEAYRLKNITTLEMLFGSIVHELIEQVIGHFLKTGQVPSETALTKRIGDRLNQGYWESANSRELWEQKPKHYTMLHEIYYSGKLPAEKVEEIKRRLGVTMKNFLDSRTFRDIQDRTRTSVFEFEQFRTMDWDGTNVFIVMDLVYRDKATGKWIITDWKTGAVSPEDRNQLALYALYLKQKFGLEDFSEIELRNEYLLDGTDAVYSPTPHDLESVAHVFGMSRADMLDYVEDPVTNKPVGLHEFEKTEHEWKCERCNFKELCETY